ncbi:MAG: hypothetical protein AAB618_01920 [Patescibacteria group bacterium]
MQYNHSPFEVGKRQDTIKNGLVRSALDYFSQTCEKLGSKARVERVPNSDTDIAIFLINDAGEDAETETAYENFLNKFQLDRAPHDPFSNKDFALDYWRDGRPYLRMTVVE